MDVNIPRPGYSCITFDVYERHNPKFYCFTIAEILSSFLLVTMHCFCKIVLHSDHFV